MHETDYLPCLVPRLGIEGTVPPRPQMPSWRAQAQMHSYITFPQVHITWYLHLSLHDAQYRPWYWLPACRTLSLKKQIFSRLVRNSPAFCGTQTFAAMSTTTRYFSVPWTTQILPLSCHPISLRSLRQHLAMPRSFFRSFSRPRFCMHLSLLPHALQTPAILSCSITTPTIL